MCDFLIDSGHSKTAERCLQLVRKAHQMDNRLHRLLEKRFRCDLKNFKEVNDFWKKYDNPLEIIFNKIYHKYLRANGQKSGVKSYNEMVGLVINYHKNEKRF